MINQLLEKAVDRRQFKRFYAKNRTFAVIRSLPSRINRIEKMSRGEIAMAVFKSKPIRMGQIIEISKGGLSFSFIEGDEDAGEDKGIDILFADDNFYISQLPFKTITESRIDNEFPFTPIIMKRRGIQFTDLSESQKTQLEYFLNNHTTGEVVYDRGNQA